jgi:hypothetical protein
VRSIVLQAGNMNEVRELCGLERVLRSV